MPNVHFAATRKVGSFLLSRIAEYFFVLIEIA